MAITVVGTPTTTGDFADAATHSVAVPTGAASGDVAVILLGQWSAAGTTPTVTAPSGFAQKGGFFTAPDGLAKNSVWWKRLTGPDSGTYAWSYQSSFWSAVQCTMFRDCATSGDPWDAVATPLTGLFNTTVASISVTNTDVSGALVWCVYNDSAATHTPPTGFTEAAEVDSMSMAYRFPGSAGSQTASGGSLSAGSDGGVWMGALLSSTGGGLPPPVAVQAAGPWPCF